MLRPLWDSPHPVPHVDTETGRVYHAPECYGADEFADDCRCGYDQSLLDAERLAMELGR